MPRVSVILPVYNTERYLERSIRSVQQQTLKDLEIICVDDHSQDGCPRILDRMAREDSRIKVIHLPENRRQGFRRNRGIDMARGDYLYFLDSDDLIRPEAMEELADRADSECLDVIFFDSDVFYDDEKLKNVYQPAFTRRHGQYAGGVLTGRDLFDRFMSNNEWTCYPQKIFWRRSFIMDEEIRYLEDVEHEDEYFAFAGILAAKRALYVPKDYFLLRVRRNSVMTTRLGPRNYHGYMMNMYYMCRFVEDRKIDDYWADKNILRMLERVKFIEATYEGAERLTSWFKKDFDWSIYRFFNMSRTEEDFLDDAMIEMLSEFPSIYIYGAGQIARRVYPDIVRRTGTCIKAFLVTEYDLDRRSLGGFPIIEYDPGKIERDIPVLVSVGKALRETICTKLSEDKIRWIYYR